MKRPPRTRKFGWMSLVQLAYSVRRDDTVLQVVVGQVPGQQRWGVLAIEAEGRTLASVLDNHAHQALPEQESLPAAMRLAEQYAAWWQGSRATHFKCECTDIDAAAEGSS